MTKQKVNNQEVDEKIDPVQEQAAQEAEAAETDTVAEEQQTATDTVAETDNTPSVEEQVAQWQDKYIRLQAEFDNYRKRTLREKMDLVESGGKDVLTAMLSVLDDVYRAVEASEKSDDITALREGEKLVLHKFEEVLAQKKVTPIAAMGEEFNPDFHEAVARFAAGEDKKGRVIDVVQRGFMLGDKVLRYAKVVVGE
ncbi:MAG: nucleotide exchange factor GrpE [Rikenellaceae bacterium]|nr:nucleotide exchange factor GrpE [Rikenellaceae bacterium]